MCYPIGCHLRVLLAKMNYCVGYNISLRLNKALVNGKVKGFLKAYNNILKMQKEIIEYGTIDLRKEHLKWTNGQREFRYLYHLIKAKGLKEYIDKNEQWNLGSRWVDNRNKNNNNDNNSNNM